MTTPLKLIACSLLLAACDLEPKYIGDPIGDSSGQATDASTSEGPVTTTQSASDSTGGVEPDSTTTGVDPTTGDTSTTTGPNPTTTTGGNESTSNGSDTSTSTSTGTTGSESTSEGTTGDVAPLSCDLPACPLAVLHCDDCPPPAEAQCVWQVLAENTPFDLVTDAFVAQAGPELTRSKWIPLGDAERHVLVQHEPFEGGIGRDPLGPSLGLQAPQLCTLAPADFFAACIQQPGGDCFEAGTWISDCAPIDPVVCPTL